MPPDGLVRRSLSWSYANETEVDTLVGQARAEIYAVTDGNAKENYVSFSEALERPSTKIDVELEPRWRGTV